jgi:hypothetical protein
MSAVMGSWGYDRSCGKYNSTAPLTVNSLRRDAKIEKFNMKNEFKRKKSNCMCRNFISIV